MAPIDSYLYLNGLRFHYRNWGGEGRAVVLLHGLAFNARIWDLVAPRLAAHFRVLALDQRSHGLTDPAESGFDFPQIARDLHAFVDTLQLERPLLVGHSWGASTVLHYAAARPAGPAGIVLVDGPGELGSIPDLTWEKAEAMLRPPDLDGMPREAFVERLKNWMGDLFSETWLDIVLAGFRLDEDDRIYRRLPIPQHMLIARQIFEQKPADLYARTRCPILLCPASPPPQQRDANSAQFLAAKREGVARAERLAPSLRTVWFEDSLHDIPLHRPLELAQAISDFGLKLSGQP